MTIEAKLFDGTVINFPDDTSESVIKDVVKRETLKLQGEKPTDRTWGEAAKDVAADLVAGTGTALQFPSQIGQLLGIFGKEAPSTGLAAVGAEMEKWGDTHTSEGLKARQAALQRRVDEENTFLGELSTAVSGTVTDPALLTSFFSRQVPNLLASYGGGKLTQAVAKPFLKDTSKQALEKVAVKGAVGTGVAMQSADIGYDTYQQAYDRLKKEGMSDEEANVRALGAGRKAAIGAGVTSYLSTKLPGARTVEKAMLGRGLPRTGGMLGAIVGEGGGEAFEEGTGKFLSNWALSDLFPDVKLGKGVGQATGLGGLGGVGFGGAAGMTLRGQPKQEAGPTLTPPADFVPGMSPEGTQTPAGEQTQPEYTFAPTMTPQELAARQYEKYTAPGIRRAESAAAARADVLSEEEAGLHEPIAPPSGLMNIPYETLTQTDPNQPPVRSTHESPVINYAGRMIAVRNINGVNVPFYLSTGFGGKKDAKSGKWYPFFGIGKDGWINKTNGKEMSNYYGSDILRQAAEELDNYYGDIRGNANIPAAAATGAQIDFINQGLTPAENGMDRTEDVVRSNIKNVIDALQRKPERPTTPEEAEQTELAGLDVRQPRVAPSFEGTGQTAEELARQQQLAQQEQLAAEEVPFEAERPAPRPVQRPEVDLGYEAEQTELATSPDVHPVVHALTENDVLSASPNKKLTPWMRSNIVGKTQQEIRDYVSANSHLLMGNTQQAQTLRKLTQPPTNVQFPNAEVNADTAAQGRIDNTVDRADSGDANAKRSIRRMGGEYTPEMRQMISEMRAKLVPMLQKFGLQGIALELVDSIENGKANGIFFRNIIRLAMDAENPVAELRHESIHALKRAGAFRPSEWNTLVKKAHEEWIDKYLSPEIQQAYLEQYLKDNNGSEAGFGDYIAEEAIAEAFKDFDANKSVKGMPTGLVNRIKAFFKALKDFFTNAGITSADQIYTAEGIFRGIEQGIFQPKFGGAEVAPAYQARQAAYSLRAAPLSTIKLMQLKPEEARTSIGLKAQPKRGENKVREVAQKLNADTVKKFGVIKDTDTSEEAKAKLAKAMANEVAYQLESTAETGTGLGWYSSNYPNAITKLARVFPELATSPSARNLFTAIVAVTSNGEKVSLNISNAIKMYKNFRDTGNLAGSEVGVRRAKALTGNVGVLEQLIEEHGLHDLPQFLMKEMTVGEINANLRKMGKKTDSSYTADTVVPRAALYFGPKLGAFYSNLMGAEGYLTMDLWWSRTFNRMRGTLIPSATEKSIKTFADLIGQPNASKDIIVAATEAPRNAYEGRNYKSELEVLVGEKEPTDKAGKEAWIKKAEKIAGKDFDALLNAQRIEKMANTIYKNEFEALNEAPFRASDRKFMYETTKEVQKLLKPKYGKLSIADIQAALWYYEKRLYSALSGGKANDIGYEEAILDHANSDRPERPTVRFDRSDDGEHVAKREGEVPKYSLRLTPEEQALAETVRANGGVSLNGRGEAVSPQSGYVVAIRSKNVKGADRAASELKHFVEENKSLLINDNVIVGMFDFGDGSGTISLDLNMIVPDRESAIRLGKALDQIAVWDIENESAINTEGSGGVGLDVPAAEALINEIRRGNYDVRLEELQSIGQVFGGAVGETKQQAQDSSGLEQPSGRPGFGSGIVLGTKVPGASSFDGVHYGTEKVSKLLGDKSGSGIRGAEQRRLAYAEDPRIKRRAYFYIAERGGKMPKPEVGLGQHVYGQRFNNILGPSAEMSRLFSETLGDSNAFESKVVDLGYDGYAVPSMGMMVILNHDVPVNYLGTKSEVTEAPKYSLRAPTTPEFKRWFAGSKATDQSGNPKVMYHSTYSDFSVPTTKFGENEWKQFGFHVGSLESAKNRLDLKARESAAEGRKLSGGENIIPAFVRAINPLRLDENRTGRWGVNDVMQAIMDKAALGEVEGIDPSVAQDYENGMFSIYDEMPSAPMPGEFDYNTEAEPKFWEDDIDWNPGEKTEALMDYLKQLGYDSIVYKNEFEKGGDSYILFDPNQIKSAFTQKPTAESKDIRYSLRQAEKLAPIVQRNANFKRWFGNSKIVGTRDRGFVNGDVAMEWKGIPEAQRAEYWRNLEQPQRDKMIEDYRNRGVGGGPRIMYHGTSRDITEFSPKQADAIFVTDDPSFAEDFTNLSEDYMAEEYFKSMPLDERQKLINSTIKQIAKDGAITKGAAQNLLEKYKDNPDNAYRSLNQFLAPVLKDKIASRANIMPVYVRAENPFDYENEDHLRQVGMQMAWNAQDRGGDANPIAWADHFVTRAGGGSWEVIETPDVQQAIRDSGFDSFYIMEGGRKNLGVYSPNQIKSAIGNVGTYGDTGDIRYSFRGQKLDRLTKLGDERTAGQKIVDTVKETHDNFGNRSWRVSWTDASDALGKRLSSLPIFDKDGRLRADYMAHIKFQSVNTIRNGLVSGIPVINSDGSVVIERSENNLARAQLVADQIDTNPIAVQQGMSGRQLVAEVARILRGKDILQEDKQLRALGEKQLRDAKAMFKMARQQVENGTINAKQYRAVIKKIAELRKEGYANRKMNRERLVSDNHIAFAEHIYNTVPEVREVLDIFREVNHGLVTGWENAGLLTKEQADEYRSNKHYVPFLKSAEDLDEGVVHGFGVAGGKGAKSTPKMKQLKGGEHIVNIWENVSKQYAKMTAMMIENQTRSVAASQLVSLGAAYETNPSDPNANLRFRRDGKEISIVAENPLDVAAFQSMNYQLSPVMKAFGVTTKALRWGALVNPMFWFRQLVRDPLHATLTTDAMVTPLHSASEFVGMLFSRDRKAVDILSARGVLGEFGTTMNIHDFLESVGKDTSRKPGMMGKAIHKVMQIHEAADAATRVAIYKQAYAKAIKNGMSEAQAVDLAVFKARESINFSVHGNSPLLANLRQMIPFLSATITSLDTLYRAAKGHNLSDADKSAAKRVFWSRAIMMVALSTVYAMMYAGDPDYDEVPDYEKDNNFLIPIQSSTDPNKKSFISIPTPFEVGFLFKTLPEVMVRYVKGTSTGKEMLASYGNGLIHNLPTGGVPIPQAVRPVLENVTNHSFFTGNPIEGMNDQRKPVHMRGDRASETAKLLSKHGLDTIGLSPAKIDNLMRGYFAEYGTFFMSLSDTAINSVEGRVVPAKNLEDMPFIKNFMTDPNVQRSVSVFYDLEGQASKTYAEFNDLKNTGNAEEINRILADPDKKAKIIAQAPLAKIGDAMTKINNEIRRINESTTMTADQKRDLINKYKAIKADLARKGVEVAEKIGLHQ